MGKLRSDKLGTAPMFKLILSMSLPAMFSMVFQALYNIIDSLFVARIGQNAFTAVTFAFPVQILMISVAIGTGIGINSLVSRRLGEGNKKDADSAATHGILLGIFSWFIFALFGLFCSKIFFQAFTSNESIIQMGMIYTQVVTIGSFGIFIEINLEKTLQATGNMLYPMAFQLTGAIINIVLNPILIFGWFGLPKLGVLGSALATIIGQTVSMLFAIFIAFTKKHDVHISFKSFRINWKTIEGIYVVGFPSIIMQAIGSVLIMGLNAILEGFSDLAVNVLGIYYRLQSFIFMPVFGLTHGVLPIMGYNFGARNKERLFSALKIGCGIGLFIMTVGTALFVIFPKPLLSIFSQSSELYDIGIPALRIISLCFPAAALGIMFSAMFQAIGMGGKSLFISILRQLIVILPVAFLLSKLGLGYVWYAFPIAECVSFVASMIIFYFLYKRNLQYLKPYSIEKASECELNQ
ncbi:MAG: efflux family protein [Oscillospiraceae bacterium]|jgi:putative MATE family efflux protein|nr:efflux family protein [Oscillospiraceae bacterium]